MAVNEEFKDFVVDQLEQLGWVTVKKMFGGAGIYYEGLIFGLLADDVLYFKVDASNKPDYEQFGMEPFRPFADKPTVMPYYEVPVEILENKERLFEWARKALSVSLNKPSKSSKGKGSGTV